MDKHGLQDRSRVSRKTPIIRETKTSKLRETKTAKNFITSSSTLISEPSHGKSESLRKSLSMGNSCSMDALHSRDRKGSQKTGLLSENGGKSKSKKHRLLSHHSTDMAVNQACENSPSALMPTSLTTDLGKQEERLDMTDEKAGEYKCNHINGEGEEGGENRSSDTTNTTPASTHCTVASNTQSSKQHRESGGKSSDYIVAGSSAVDTPNTNHSYIYDNNVANNSDEDLDVTGDITNPSGLADISSVAEISLGLSNITEEGTNSNPKKSSDNNSDKQKEKQKYFFIESKSNPTSDDQSSIHLEFAGTRRKRTTSLGSGSAPNSPSDPKSVLKKFSSSNSTGSRIKKQVTIEDRYVLFKRHLSSEQEDFDSIKTVETDITESMPTGGNTESLPDFTDSLLSEAQTTPELDKDTDIVTKVSRDSVFVNANSLWDSCF